MTVNFSKPVLIFLFILAMLLSGCRKDDISGINIIAGGASFPYPLYQEMFKQYNMDNEIWVNYQAVGSGTGIKKLLDRTIDFGGTDAFLSDQQLIEADGDIVHIPTCLGGVTLSYNLSLKAQLKLTPELISNIFMGKITNWNNKEIQAENPGIVLPDQDITVVHRSDSSGTTFIFSDYLSKVNAEWSVKIGRGKILEWPVGTGARKNSGVAAQLKQLPGAIGYIEVAYARENNIPYAQVKNESGNFISPDLTSISLAGAGVIPDDTRTTITNTRAEYGYPISGFTWLILYKEQNYQSRSKKRSKAILDVLWWMIHDGQDFNEILGYGKLPENVVRKSEKILKDITFDGKKIL